MTDEYDFPAIGAPRGVRKEELVEPYYPRFKGTEGVACVLTSLEQAAPSSPARRGASRRAVMRISS
jgi:hypothetical protein